MKPKPAEPSPIDTLREENIILRDAVEELACRLVKSLGKNPHSLMRGMPLWIAHLPERVRELWKKGGGGGRGGGFAR